MRSYLALVETFLSEAGIQTAAIDRAARTGIAQFLPMTIRALISHTKRMIGPAWRDDDASEAYDQLCAFWTKQTDEFAGIIYQALTECLTEVTQRHVVEIFPTLPPKTIDQIVAMGYTPQQLADEVKVHVDATETSGDVHRHNTGGYFRASEMLIKVFVPTNQLLHAGFNLVADAMVGESDNHGMNALLQLVMPIFVHEYAHLEQFLRHLQPYKADFGYVTAGQTGRKGKRGGMMRSFDTPQAALRYRGNVNEIDSFAADAACELMHQIEHSNANASFGYDVADLNRAIRDLRQALANGDAMNDASSYHYYVNLLWMTFEGRYAHLGVKPDEITKVWKRFAKLVYQKLGAYEVLLAGKTGATPAKFKKDWIEATKLPRTQAIRAIAESTAQVLAGDAFGSGQEAAEKIAAGRNYTASEAAQFIVIFYFGLWDDSEHAEKTKQLFCELTAKYYLRALAP